MKSHSYHKLNGVDITKLEEGGFVCGKFFFVSFQCHAYFNGLLVNAAENDEDDIPKRMELYQSVETLTNIPWYYLAAVDQYERNVRQSRKDLPKAEGITGIYIPPEKWVGPLNPNKPMKTPCLFNFSMEWVLMVIRMEKPPFQVILMSSIPLPIIF